MKSVTPRYPTIYGLRCFTVDPSPIDEDGYKHMRTTISFIGPLIEGSPDVQRLMHLIPLTRSEVWGTQPGGALI